MLMELSLVSLILKKGIFLRTLAVVVLQDNLGINPFTPTSDQDRISPYNINTISSREVMRIEKNVNHGIIS